MESFFSFHTSSIFHMAWLEHVIYKTYYAISRVMPRLRKAKKDITKELLYTVQLLGSSMG